MAKRLFIALPLNAPAIAELNALVHMCKRLARSTKWVRPEQMHVTLKFLGDVEEEREEDIVTALETAAAMAPFTFNLAGVGAFPNPRRPRVIWTGIDRGRDEVTTLAERVDAELAAKKFAREARPFSPHVTIGRVREPANFDELWRAVEATPFTGTAVDAREVRLVHSTLTPKGPIYNDLATIPLQGNVG